MDLVTRTGKWTAPRARGAGNYGRRRARVMLESVEALIAICPASDRLLQYEMQRLWMKLKDRVEAEGEQVAAVVQRTFGDDGEEG